MERGISLFFSLLLCSSTLSSVGVKREEETVVQFPTSVRPPVDGTVNPWSSVSPQIRKAAGNSFHIWGETSQRPLKIILDKPCNLKNADDLIKKICSRSKIFSFSLNGKVILWVLSPPPSPPHPRRPSVQQFGNFMTCLQNHYYSLNAWKYILQWFHEI